MLNRNLRGAICLLIGVFLLIGSVSFAHELPPVSITASHGSTYTILSYGESHTAWIEHEQRLSTANQELQKLRYERDIIDAAISGNRTELKKFKTVTILVAGRRIGFGALVNTMVDFLDNGNTYEMGLQRISTYSSIRSQNSAIASAASDRDTFHTEFVKRWHHREEHLSSQGGTAPGHINPAESESIPMLGAGCANACGVFWYDSTHAEYYSGFSGGIPAFLGWIPGLARSSHRTTCMGTASCGVGYWTCEGNESGGTARHKFRTCEIQGRQWNSASSSYDTVTCNMDYRNCDNPGGRCFNGSSTGNQKHNDDVSAQNSYASVSPSGGSYSASAGDSHTANFTSSSAFSTLYWYVKSPSESGLGTNVETDTGSSSTTSASMTYTFPSSASGDYVITAYVYNYSDGTTYEATYTVNVSGSSSSDATPNCSDCTSDCSSPCSCSNSGTCGGSDSTPDCSYCTSGCSSCPSSDTLPSTPSPPEPTTVACGGASYTGCSGASSRTEHHVPSCSKGCGNGYWTCSADAHLHTDEKTCKRSGCSATLTSCQNGPSACVRPGKPDNWHWL